MACTITVTKKPVAERIPKNPAAKPRYAVVFTEYSILLEHDKADDGDRKPKIDDPIENLRVGCQHCRRIICGRNVAHMLVIVGSCGI